MSNLLGRNTSSLEKSKIELKVRFNPAGHILGSAYLEILVKKDSNKQKIVFSGDLGAPYTPLLPAPKPPYSADILILEATYGNRVHKGRKQRKEELKRIIEKSFENRGVVLIPAFAVGRTQELLYEIEEIIHKYGEQEVAGAITWNNIDIIVDSPLAGEITEVYQRLASLWDKEARLKLKKGRHPLSFEEMLVVASHAEHKNIISYLKKSKRPAIVIAGSGMCTGGRIVNYLKELISDSCTDILFVGYQAGNTPGHYI